jgi:hypothetical protein
MDTSHWCLASLRLGENSSVVEVDGIALPCGAMTDGPRICRQEPASIVRDGRQVRNRDAARPSGTGRAVILRVQLKDFEIHNVRISTHALDLILAMVVGCGPHEIETEGMESPKD